MHAHELGVPLPVDEPPICVDEPEAAVADYPGVAQLDLVLHGHAHAGSFEGCIGDIPVYNVAVHVTGRNFWIFELDGGGVRRGGEVVEVREPPQ